MLVWFMLLGITSALCCDLRPLQKLSVALATSRHVRISWSAPEDLQCVRGYKICAAAQDGGSVPPSCVRVQNPHIGGYVITGLQPCGQYNLSVATLGEDDAQSPATSMTANTAPSAAADLVVYRGGSSEGMRARWRYDASAAGGGCAKKFKLTWCTGKGSTSSCIVARVPVITSTTYWQQPPYVHYCSEYTVALVVLDASESSSDPIRASVHELSIEGPQNLTVASYTSRSITVQWGIPENQLTCIYHVFIDVAFTNDSSRNSFEATFDSGMTSYAINSTVPCKAYTITVGFGTSVERKNASVVAYTLPIGDEIFSNASVHDVTSSSVTVAWTTVLDSYECITSYSVCWRKDSTDVCRQTTSDRFEITGLQPDTTYNVSVEVRLGNGFPLESRVLAVTTSGAAGLLASSMIATFVVLNLLRYIPKDHCCNNLLLEQLTFT